MGGEGGMTTAVGAEPVRPLGKIGLEYTFQYHSDDFLHKLVIPGGDSERMLFLAILFHNIFASGRLCVACACRISKSK